LINLNTPLYCGLIGSYSLRVDPSVSSMKQLYDDIKCSSTFLEESDESSNRESSLDLLSYF